MAKNTKSLDINFYTSLRIPRIFSMWEKKRRGFSQLPGKGAP
jgi:hypothetical protein